MTSWYLHSHDTASVVTDVVTAAAVDTFYLQIERVKHAHQIATYRERYRYHGYKYITHRGYAIPAQLIARYAEISFI